MTTLDHRLILQPEPDAPETALPLVLGPALAACGVEVVVETATPLPGGAEHLTGSNFSIATTGHVSPDGYRTVPVAPLIADGDWPATRSLGQLRFHEAAAVLNKRIDEGPLVIALRQAGAAILNELSMWEPGIAFSVIDGAWSSGTAGERFQEVLGDAALDAPESVFPTGRHKTDVFADRRGTIAGWHRPALAKVLHILGPTGSITHLAPANARPGPRQPIARLWSEKAETGKKAEQSLLAALRYA